MKRQRTNYLISISDKGGDVQKMIKELAGADMRSIGAEVSFLILKEYQARKTQSQK